MNKTNIICTGVIVTTILGGVIYTSRLIKLVGKEINHIERYSTTAPYKKHKF